MGGEEQRLDIDKSLEKLSTLLRDIVRQAEQNSAQRCPYKNIKDHCTAAFRCRNQARIHEEPGTFRCTGDHKLAWLEPLGKRNDQHAENPGSD